MYDVKKETTKGPSLNTCCCRIRFVNHRVTVWRNCDRHTNRRPDTCKWITSGPRSVHAAPGPERDGRPGGKEIGDQRFVLGPYKWPFENWRMLYAIGKSKTPENLSLITFWPGCAHSLLNWISGPSGRPAADRTSSSLRGMMENGETTERVPSTNSRRRRNVSASSFGEQRAQNNYGVKPQITWIMKHVICGKNARDW